MCVLRTCGVALLFLATTLVHAQQEAKNWFFGDKGGLTFSASPIPYPTGTPTMNTQEGSAVISDSSGNLIFYTDGVNVYGPNHALISGGTGLKGGSSATQSAIIVPFPDGKCDKYYIFTVEAQEDVPTYQSLYFSIVTVSGGVPSVTSKNNQLKTYVSEKLTGIADPTGGFWVIAHGYDKSNKNNPVNAEFYAFHVGTGGVTGGPTSTGFVHASGSNASTGGIGSSGQMQISPDGTKIACAVNTAFVEILDFNVATGQVGPGYALNADPVLPKPKFQESSIYGLEFSPDSQFLYVSTLSAPSRLYQITVGTTTVTLIATGNGQAGVRYDIGQLQLGPDGNLYVARDTSTSISMVNNPNATGATLVPGPVLAAGATSRLGLPTVIQGPSPCSGVTVNCPPGSTPTAINGVIFCCRTDPVTGRICCSKPCPAGTIGTTINGVAYCCDLHGPIGTTTSQFCCTKN